MPRGVAITEPRQHLFAAAERVVVTSGPHQLTSRAVTREAGVATGLLFAHFTGFDDFLIGYAVDRSFQIAGTAAALAGHAGTGTIAGNLCAAVLATPLVTLLTISRLTAWRPALTAEVEAVLGPGGAPLPALERAVTAYLTAERDRLPAHADAEALALAVVGLVHHVALTDGASAKAAGRIRRAVTALVEVRPATMP
ncbi:TetR family transcriptional regulator [Actinoplanes sp. NPDC020271]|uniref:TetR family transcriptional regulator n=1 Tax=Actinoplanes sp. NPDC020271 TaxID=3363896 RepID=UPI0037BC8015